MEGRRTLPFVGAPSRSIAPRVAALFFLLIALVLGATFVTVRSRVVEAHEASLGDRGDGLSALASQLFRTPLELDALEAGEETVDALLADPAVLEVEVLDARGSWLVAKQPGAERRASRLFERAITGISGAPIGEVRLWIDDAHFVAARRAALRDGAVQAVLLLLLGMVVTTVLVRRLVRPLASVTEAADAIARGRVEQPLTLPSSQDEIGRAGLAFARMQARLHELSECARRVAAGHLDPPNLGTGPLFERFEAMVNALAEARQRDEAQRARLEEALVRAEAASEAKGRFLARMSHELRTPLNGALGMADLLLTDPSVLGRAREAVQILQSSALEMLTLVEQVLEFAEVDVGALTLEPRALELDRLIHEVVEKLAPAARQKGLSLVAEMSTPMPRGMTDPRALRRVISCLVDNGLKFTAQGGVTVRASVDRSMARARIEVRDTGSGISEADRDRIFEAFEQLDGGSTRAHRGLGVGLALSTALTRALQGRLDFHSKLGEGTTFWIDIPFGPLVEDPERSRRAPEPEKPTPTSAGKPKILVVEDERVNQIVVRRHLEALGAEVSVVENGLEALEASRACRFDLIFMDCMMPVMDGYDATRAIRSEERPGTRVPIIALTANALPADRERCLLAGMDEHIAKPIRRGVLADAIERFTGRRGSW